VTSHAGGEKIKKVKLQTLRKQYELLQMEEGDQIGEYFNKVLTVTNQMKGCGETIIDMMIVEKIMRSLPRKFDYIVVAIEESHDLAIMKVEELQSSLEAHEIRLVNRSPIKKVDQALKVHHLRVMKRNNKRNGENNKPMEIGNLTEVIMIEERVIQQKERGE